MAGADAEVCLRVAGAIGEGLTKVIDGLSISALLARLQGCFEVQVAQQPWDPFGKFRATGSVAKSCFKCQSGLIEILKGSVRRAQRIESVTVGRVKLHCLLQLDGGVAEIPSSQQFITRSVVGDRFRGRRSVCCLQASEQRECSE